MPENAFTASSRATEDASKPDPSAPKRSFVKGLSWECISNLACFGLACAMFVTSSRMKVRSP